MHLEKEIIMDILILMAMLLISLSMISGKPLRIEITQKLDVPPAQEIKSDTNPDIDVDEMKKNATNIMSNFNKEWSGITDDDRE
jgi:hypothetical protein